MFFVFQASSANCPADTWYTISLSLAKGVCSTLEGAGYVVYSRNELSTLNELFGSSFPLNDGLFPSTNPTNVNQDINTISPVDSNVIIGGIQGSGLGSSNAQNMISSTTSNSVSTNGLGQNTRPTEAGHRGSRLPNFPLSSQKSATTTRASVVGNDNGNNKNNTADDFEPVQFIDFPVRGSFKDALFDDFGRLTSKNIDQQITTITSIQPASLIAFQYFSTDENTIENLQDSDSTTAFYSRYF